MRTRPTATRSDADVPDGAGGLRRVAGKRSSGPSGRGPRREAAQVIGVTVRAPTDDTDAEAPPTKLVEIIAAHTGAFGVRLSTELRTGHPAQEILAAARAHQADLLVMGHSGHSGAWGRFLGTTAEKVSRHAECSVLIIR